MSQELEAAQHTLDAWQLGQTSSHYESRGQVGTISSGEKDPGGVSYGLYQFSTTRGSAKAYASESAYAHPYFKGLTPNTPEFDHQWRELAKIDPARFAQDQHDYATRTYFDTINQNLKKDGIDLSDRGRAVQDALWSTSVQFGGNGGVRIFSNAIQEKLGKDHKLADLSDRDIIETVQDYKIKNNNILFASTPEDRRPNLLHRAHNEKTELLRLAADEYTVAHDGQKPDWAPPAHLAHHRAHVLRQGSHGQPVTDLQTQLQTLGYLERTDAHDRPLPLGHFGPATRHAVQSFQHDHHLPANGAAGSQTLDTLHKAIEEQRTQEQPERKSSAYSPQQGFSTGDSDLDRLAAALFSGNEAAISRASTQIAQSPQVQTMAQQGRDILAAQQLEEQQQAMQQRGPSLSR
jgi:peptidoglycan hydrolase-like protein with peptidoglycan-binding domain